MFLLEGFDGVEAAGAADLSVAGVFCGVEEETLSADKGKTCTLSQNFSKFPVKSVFFQWRQSDCRSLPHQDR